NDMPGALAILRVVFRYTKRLKMHPGKSQLFETRFGANFVGFRILPDRIRVRNDNLRRSRKRMKALQRQYEAWEIDLDVLVQRLRSWEAHLMHGDTHRLRRKLFDYWVFVRGDIDEVTAHQLLNDENELF
ncbi:MAG: hypothetical protein ABG776_01270, partial [Cyanobacteria bacterium J06555_13]